MTGIRAVDKVLTIDTTTLSNGNLHVEINHQAEKPTT
jgi:hypothetical protein